MKHLKLLQILLLVSIVFITCGKDDKNNEYVDENSSKQTDTKQQEKMSSENKSENTQTKTEDTLKNSYKEKQDSKQYNSFQNEKPVAVISPVEAGDYNGKTVTVKGFVADVYKSEKVAYLNFVEKYPNNPFTAVIFARQFDDFPDIGKYRGKDVEVTGRVSFFKGKPQIIINNPGQLKLK